MFALHRLALDRVGIRPGDGVYYDDDFARIEEVYLHGAGGFLVGEVDGRLVAIGAVRAVTSDIAEIVRMRVHPDLQRHGYGSALLRRLEERALELGYTVARVDTTVYQRAALALYRKQGYRETGRRVVAGIENVYAEKCLR